MTRCRPPGRRRAALRSRQRAGGAVGARVVDRRRRRGDPAVDPGVRLGAPRCSTTSHRYRRAGRSVPASGGRETHRRVGAGPPSPAPCCRPSSTATGCSPRRGAPTGAAPLLPSAHAADRADPARRRVRAAHRRAARRRPLRRRPPAGGRHRRHRAAEGSDDGGRRSGRRGAASSTAATQRLATAGTGDVLAGMIGALLAHRDRPLRRGGGRGVDARRGGRRALPRPDRWPATSSTACSPRTCCDRSAATTARRCTCAIRRWAWAEIDLDAVAHNVGVLRAAVAPVGGVGGRQGRRLRPRRGRRRPSGAGRRREGLCVALAAEGVALREAGIDAPILVLSEQPPERAGDDRRAPADADRVHAARSSTRSSRPSPIGLPVHLKIDTGMHRVGAAPARRSPRSSPRSQERSPAVELAGVFTHLAVADEPDDPFTATQLARFDDVLDARAGVRPRRPRGQLGRCAGASGRPTVVRARRASRCTGSRRARASTTSPPTLRPVMALKARVSLRQAGCGRAADLLRPAPPVRHATRPWRPSRSATPTVSAAAVVDERPAATC